MKKVLAIIGLVLLVALMGGPLSWAQEPIVVGGVAPLSAPGAAESGAEMKIAMEMAVDEIGKILGRPIKLQVEDTRGLPEEGHCGGALLCQGHQPSPGPIHPP